MICATKLSTLKELFFATQSLKRGGQLLSTKLGCTISLYGHVAIELIGAAFSEKTAPGNMLCYAWILEVVKDPAPMSKRAKKKQKKERKEKLHKERIASQRDTILKMAHDLGNFSLG